MATVVIRLLGVRFRVNKAVLRNDGFAREGGRSKQHTHPAGVLS